MAVLGGWAVSYERGTPVGMDATTLRVLHLVTAANHATTSGWGLQGYLAHQKQPLRGTLP